MTQADLPADATPDDPQPTTPDDPQPTTADTPDTPPPAAPVSAEPVEPVAPPAAEPAVELPSAPSAGVYWGTGRRKSAIARVRLVPGQGKVTINKRMVDEYFAEPQERLAVHESLTATKTENSFDVFINVRGGGHSGQAGAIRLGMARALVKANAGYEAALREKNYLTRDSRVVERKKPGQRKARRRFQFSKR